MARELKPTEVITGKVRLSYPHLFKPQKDDDGKEAKYSCSAIISKSDKVTIAAVEKAIEEAKKLYKEKFGSKIPSTGLEVAFYDGDVKKADDPAYANSMYLSCYSNTKPGVIGVDRKPIEDEEEVYAGCIVRLSLNFYPYSNDRKKGIGVGLNNVLKVADGERLAGRASAQEDFDDYFDTDANDAANDLL